MFEGIIWFERVGKRCKVLLVIDVVLGILCLKVEGVFLKMEGFSDLEVSLKY